MASNISFIITSNMKYEVRMKLLPVDVNEYESIIRICVTPNLFLMHTNYCFYSCIEWMHLYNSCSTVSFYLSIYVAAC